MLQTGMPDLEPAETQSAAARNLVNLYFGLEAVAERHKRLAEYVEKEC